MIQLVIDHREGKLKTLCQEQTVNLGLKNMLQEYTDDIVYENLQSGDIVILNDNAPVLIFERKTLSDVIASVKDGRYKNQKIKLLSQYQASQIYYIIEGYSCFRDCDEMIKGVLINTMLRDKIGIFFTKTQEDTLELVLNIYKRYRADPNKYNGTVKLDVNDKQVSKPSRCCNKNETYINILCQVPGISKKTALAIAEKYPSLNSLYEENNKLNNDEKLNAFKNITTCDSQGKSRKISGTIAKSLVEILFS
jgi:ERCC4-type nuclease